MTVWLAGHVQNQLLWRVGTGRVSECWFALRDGAGHPGVGSDMARVRGR